MKSILSIIILILVVKTSFAIKFDTLYFDSKGKQTTQFDYDYKRVISKVEDNQYFIKDYYHDNHNCPKVFGNQLAKILIS